MYSIMLYIHYDKRKDLIKGMKLGARILKTGIAITLALFACILLNLPSPVFAGISAIFAVQPSVYRSYLTALEQIQANVIGAVFAIAFATAFGHNPFIIGLTCILVIALTLQLRLENTISIALVTVIAIMEYQGEDFFSFAFFDLRRLWLELFGFTCKFSVYAAKIRNKVISSHR